MNLKTKNQVLTVLVIFLVVLNLATLGSIFYHIRQVHSYQQDNTLSKNNKTIQTNRQSRAQRGYRHLSHIFNDLELTPEQRKYFIQKRREFFTANRGILDSLRMYRRVLDSLACSQNIDTVQVKFYSHKIANLHYTLAYNYTILVNEWYKVCPKTKRSDFCNLIKVATKIKR